MKKLRFTADHRESLGRTKDYLISLKLRGHGNWALGDVMDGPDGKVHFDAVSFSEDPEFDPERLAMYTAAGTMVSEVALDVKPSEPVTTPRYVQPSTAYEMTSKVLGGAKAEDVVEDYIMKILGEDRDPRAVAWDKAHAAGDHAEMAKLLKSKKRDDDRDADERDSVFNAGKVGDTYKQAKARRDATLAK